MTHLSGGAKAMMTRDDWIVWIQRFLEERINDAPDESCRTLANNLWEQTKEFEDD